MKENPARHPVEGVRPFDSTENPDAPLTGGMQVRRTVTIDRPKEELYAFWRRLENLPQFMENVVAVTEMSDRESRWVVKAPAGRTVEWSARIIEDEPASTISWRSTTDADVDNAGSVLFRDAPNGRGTWVTVTLTYNPPGGRLGSSIAMLFGEEPSQQLPEDLRRFKALMETGEVPVAGLDAEPAASLRTSEGGAS